MSAIELEGCNAMELVRTPAHAKLTAKRLMLLLLATAAVLSFTPWQQAADGQGTVVAFAPEERRQKVEAPIDGRILRWRTREGARILKGEPMVELADNDPDIMDRLRAERASVEGRLTAARDRATSVRERMSALSLSGVGAVAAAESRITMASQRIVAAEQAVELARAALNAAELNIERQESLALGGLSSRRTVELAQVEVTRARTEVERAKAALAAARSERAAISSDRSKVTHDAKASVDDANAQIAAADSEIANASGELVRIDVKLARQAAQSVVAPHDGVVFKIIANGQEGEYVKTGDSLAILIPDTQERAAELWIDGNDMPLVQPGDIARVQFEGWPALQFSGWPAVAVGTFPARVALVDASDNGNGKFRVLVVPVEGSDWPTTRHLRQGVRTQGWIQLGRVALGYELWRRFNGFPAALPKEPDGKLKAPSS